MRIEFENTYKKHYIEVLPSLAIRKKAGSKTHIYLAWLFFVVNIEL